VVVIPDEIIFLLVDIRCLKFSQPNSLSVKQFDKSLDSTQETHIMAECKRRPELGLYDPTAITFQECPEWQETTFGYMLKDMRVMILGIDGYLGWTLALWLGLLGCKVSGVDNYNRRNWVKERGAHTIVPIDRMNERLRAAKEVQTRIYRPLCRKPLPCLQHDRCRTCH